MSEAMGPSPFFLNWGPAPSSCLPLSNAAFTGAQSRSLVTCHLPDDHRGTIMSPIGWAFHLKNVDSTYLASSLPTSRI